MSHTSNELAALVAGGRATIKQMEELGADTVAAIKTNPEILQVRVKAQEPLAINEEQRKISYVVSDETPDRVGDIIQVKGWDLTNYKRNPVILWAHEAKEVPPIGRGHNVRRRYGPDRLTADVEFAPKEAYEFADTIYQLASRGFIRATSVGFMPKEAAQLDKDQRAKLGLGSYGQLFTRSELMEISIVAVPANPSALEEGVKSLHTEGLLDRMDVQKFLDRYPATELDAARQLRSKIRSFVDFGAIQKLAPGEAKVGDMVRWNSSGGTARGKITRIVRDGKVDVPDSSFTVTGTPDDPAALIRVYRDDEPTDRIVGHKLSTLKKDQKSVDYDEKAEEAVQETEPQEEAVEAQAEEKEAPMEVKDVSKLRDALSSIRAAADMIGEAIDMYSTSGDDEYDSAPEGGNEERSVEAVAYLVEQQAEQTKATRQLVDALTDLTVKLREERSSGDDGDCGCPQSDAKSPDAAVIETKDIEGLLDSVSRGFADRVRRELSNKPKND